MKITSSSLNALRAGFKTSFMGGLAQASSQYGQIATTVTSTSGSEKYGWLGKMPRIREWIGDRVIQNLMEHDYEIKNKPFELTIGVDRDDIDDDNLGVYGPLFQDMGMETAVHPDTLCFPLLNAGFSTLCYDGQNFFDTDHPVLDENGEATSVANTDGGSGTPGSCFAPTVLCGQSSIRHARPLTLYRWMIRPIRTSSIAKNMFMALMVVPMSASASGSLPGDPNRPSMPPIMKSPELQSPP